MTFSLGVIIEALVLTSALALDAMVSGFAYGTNGIKIPLRSTTIITIICSSMLAASMFLGSLLNRYITDEFSTMICFILLLLLGLYKLFESFFKTLIQKSNGIKKNIKFSLFNLSFILNIYASPEAADKDSSHILSPGEAASLAVALSFDSLAVGFGAGLQVSNFVLIIIFSLITNAAAIIAGCFAGNKLAQKTTFNLSWLGGVLLIILAFMKL